MKRLLPVIVLLFIMTGHVHAETTPLLKPDNQAQTSNTLDENGLDSHKHYVNKDG